MARSIPIPEPGPEFAQLGELAIELSGDLSLGRWVTNMARLDHSAAAIRYALEQGAAAGKWGAGWLQSILKRVAVDGIPAPPKGQAAKANGVLPSQYIDPATKAHNEKIRQLVIENEKKREARNA